MKTWTRAVRDQKCGRCAGDLKRGDPILTYRRHGGRFVNVRCRHCAGEPVPANLAPVVDVRLAFKPMVPIPTGRDALPFDFKSASAGRDPGEDG